MSQSNKTWLKIASVISWIFACSIIFVGLAVVFDYFNMREILEEYIAIQVNDHSNPHQYSFVRFMVFAETLLACVINIYSGIVYWSISNKNYIIAGGSRVLSTTGIFQILFTANAFSAIIAFCVASSFKNTVWQKSKDNDLEYISYEIEKIRVLKDKGVITEEEFQTRLNGLIDQYSKEKNKQ